MTVTEQLNHLISLTLIAGHGAFIGFLQLDG